MSPSAPQTHPSSSCPQPETASPKSDSAPSSPQPPHGSQEGSPSSAEPPVPGFATLGRRLMLASEPVGHLQHYSSMEGISSARGSPASEGTSTPTFPLSPGYYQPAESLGSCSGHPGSSAPQPPLPEKRRQGAVPGSPNGRLGSLRPGAGGQQSVQHHVTFSPSVGVGEVSLPAGQSEGVITEEDLGNRVSVKFVQDSSRFWYKPGISRDQGN